MVERMAPARTELYLTVGCGALPAAPAETLRGGFQHELQSENTQAPQLVFHLLTGRLLLLLMCD